MSKELPENPGSARQCCTSKRRTALATSILRHACGSVRPRESSTSAWRSSGVISSGLCRFFGTLPPFRSPILSKNPARSWGQVKTTAEKYLHFPSWSRLVDELDRLPVATCNQGDIERGPLARVELERRRPVGRVDHNRIGSRLMMPIYRPTVNEAAPDINRHLDISVIGN